MIFQKIIRIFEFKYIVGEFHFYNLDKYQYFNILIKNAINRSLNAEEKIDLNIKTFNPKNKVYFRKFYLS